jgi:hypothetical protein
MPTVLEVIVEVPQEGTVQAMEVIAAATEAMEDIAADFLMIPFSLEASEVINRLFHR